MHQMRQQTTHVRNSYVCLNEIIQPDFCPLGAAGPGGIAPPQSSCLPGSKPANQITPFLL